LLIHRQNNLPAWSVKIALQSGKSGNFFHFMLGGQPCESKLITSSKLGQALTLMVQILESCLGWLTSHLSVFLATSLSVEYGHRTPITEPLTANFILIINSSIFQ